MRYVPRATDEQRREDLIALRKRQTEQLVERGLGRGDDTLPVLAFTGLEGGDRDPGAHFLAIDGRILVPREQAARVQGLLGDDAGQTIDLRTERFVAVELRRGGVVQTLRRLTEQAPEVRASPQHLVFPAYRSKGQEGEDPEPVDPSKVGQPPEGEVLPGAGVLVAVVDTGVAETALDDPWLEGVQFDTDDIDPLRERETGVDPVDGALFHDLEAGHGTMVLSVVRMVAPGCDLRVIRALDSDGIATDDEIARAIDEASSLGADVINLSLGGYTDQNLPPPVIEDAIARVDPDTVIVAAAGNYFDERPVWPGAIRRVVSVAALEQNGNEHGVVLPDLAWYTSRGWWVDVAAPGTWATVFVTGRENPERELEGPPDQFEGYAEGSGSSLAAAAITGALAVELDLLRQAARGTEPIPARLAIGKLRARGGNVRLPQGTMAVDVWDGA
jgi:hypothetical protein